MCTACLPPGVPQVKEFEQVSIQSLSPDVISRGDPYKRRVDPLYDEVQHIMGNGHMGQTDMTENICWQVVIMPS